MPNLHVNADASPAALRARQLRAGYLRRWPLQRPRRPGIRIHTRLRILVQRERPGNYWASITATPIGTTRENWVTPGDFTLALTGRGYAHDVIGGELGCLN